jgi:hypothetical protein
MSNYDNSNRIALWLNDKREKQTHPHLKGQGETSEAVYASAWFSDDISDDDKKALQAILKRYTSKKPFISVSLKSRAEASQGAREAAQSSPPTTNSGFDDDFDDILF